jgi:hypothetical protein
VGVRLKGGGMRSMFRVPRFESVRFSGTSQLVALPLLILNFLLVEREVGGRHRVEGCTPTSDIESIIG